MFSLYLAAKKGIDDRALNRHVWQNLASALSPQKTLKILEVGAGIGTMVERTLSWNLFTQAIYTAVDLEICNIAEARRRLPHWAKAQGFQARKQGEEKLFLESGSRKVMVETEAKDVFQFAAQERGRKTWDLLLAHAFLDLVDVPQILPPLFSLLRPGGLFYFTLNFDGITIFQPEIDPPLDREIVSLYHQTMGQRSHTGRKLFSCLREARAELLDAGSSDWIVFAGPQGCSHDETYFLHLFSMTSIKPWRVTPTSTSKPSTAG